MHTSIRLLITGIFLLLCSNAIAQQQAISGTVKDSTVPIVAATVSLLHAEDSAWISATITDDNGAFFFANVPQRNYLISVTALGYTPAVMPTTISPMHVTLQKESAGLKEVTVIAKKPFIEMSLGKMIVNVDGSTITTGLTVLELLRKMPGVLVDQAGNISMLGKQGVLVLIDDKPTYLSADQLADYLKAMPADELEQVELITQPSARYDAAGNAGVINLKRKKIHRDGFNGTASLTQGQGIYAYTQGSALLNYKIKKLNILLAADENRATGFAAWQESQQLIDPATHNAMTNTNIQSTAVEHFSIANLRLAADYDMSSKASIGASIKGGYHTNSMLDNIHSATQELAGNTTTSDTIISPEGFIRKDLTANAYLLYKFNNASTFNLNFDYLNYSNNPYQNINNTQYDAQGQPVPDPLILQSNQPTLIKVYSIKGDYTDTLRNGIKLETGFKSSLVNTDNNAAFNIEQNNTWIPDTTRSNRFTYRENINALYISASKALGAKWQVSAGLRAENTNAQGIQQVHGNKFDKNYVSLFPTAYISYKQDKDNQFELNYGRRIDRPTYQSLNPFIYYSFQYNYSVGNPLLQPQYTNNIELKHSYKNTLITTIGFTNTNGVINDVLIADNSTGIVYSTQQNIGTNNGISLSLVFNKDFFKWWSLNAYMYAYYAHYKGSADNYPLISSGTGVYAGATNQFSLGKGWKAEADIYYTGTGIETIISRHLPSTYIGFGATKKLNDHNTVKVIFDDPLYTFRYKNETTLPNLVTNAAYRTNTRVFGIAYTYNFGSGQSKQHEANVTDESKRIK